MASPVPVPLERSKTGYSEPIDRSRVYSFSDQFHIKGDDHAPFRPPGLVVAVGRLSLIDMMEEPPTARHLVLPTGASIQRI
ncbi:hypothetical protein Lal_00002201 [Lupinus albus]|nr:hypothetical protein Lal_00002201 [Lupinus albus]